MLKNLKREKIDRDLPAPAPASVPAPSSSPSPLLAPAETPARQRGRPRKNPVKDNSLSDVFAKKKRYKFINKKFFSSLSLFNDYR